MGPTGAGTSGLVRAVLALVSAAALASACGAGGDGDPPPGEARPPVTVSTAASDGGSAPTSAGGTPTSGAIGRGSPDTVSDLSGAAIELTQVAEAEAPIALASRSGSTALYLAERARGVRVLRVEESSGERRYALGQPVVDLSPETSTEGERGVLGLAFSPDGSRLYVSFTDRAGDTRVDEWRMDGEVVVAESRRNVFGTEQPYANHNGGQISFGPDGYLYIALGDGGGGGDPLGNAQDPHVLLGSILRLDPLSDGDAPYAIPADNPFADGSGGAPEVWMYGLRNPWRFSWDSATGDLWVADVGQERHEEITWLPRGSGGEPAGRGANLGWPIFEGDDEFLGGTVPERYVAPTFSYGQGPGCSVTGGYVSRGESLAALRGAYLYSDYCDPTIMAVLARDGVVVDARSLGVDVPGGQAASFGEGPDGELYVLSLSGGVFRIDPA